MPGARLIPRHLDLVQARRRITVRVPDEFHQQYALVYQMRRGHSHAHTGQPIQRVNFRVLPLGFLHFAPVTTPLAHGASVAAAACAASLLILGQLVKPPVLSLFVYLGAAQSAAAVHDVNRGLLTALQTTHDGIDHAVVDQRLQALGDFHRRPV
jgi:hypothetical protein